MDDTMKAADRLMRPVQRRLTLKAAAGGCWAGLLAGLCAAAVAVIVSFFTPMESLPLVLAALVVAGPAFGTLYALAFRRPGRLRAARALDGLGGCERAVTMLELAGRGDAYAVLQRQDAMDVLPAIDVKTGIGIKPPRWMALCCASIALVVLASFAIPNVQRDILNARRETRQAIRKQAEKLEAELDKLKLDDMARAQLHKLAQEMKNAQTMSDALKQLAKAEDSLKPLAAQQAEQARNRLAGGFEGNSSTKPLADALKKKDEQDYAKKAAELVKDLKDGKLGEAGKAALQQSLSSAADDVSDGELADALNDAAAALGNLTDEQASAALEAALKAAGKAADGTSGAAVDAQALLKAARAQLGAASASLANSPNEAGSETGTGNGNGTGAGSGSGTGTGSGSGSGSGTGAGAGTGGGPDSENEQAGGYGDGYNSGYAPGSMQPQTSYESIFVPDRLGGSDAGVTGGGIRNDGGRSDMIDAGPGQGSAGDFVPYNQVVYEYQSEAAQAMDRENVPAGMRQWVERYFSSITN